MHLKIRSAQEKRLFAFPDGLEVAVPIDPLALFVTLPIVGLTLTFVYVVRVTSEPAPDAEEKRSTWERARRTGYWASSTILSVVYVMTGLPKLTGFDDILHRFSAWGYSEDFALFIGVSEFLAGILLLIPGLSLYAAAYLGLIMVGAVYTHLAFDPFVWTLLPIVCLSFLAFIGYEDWERRAASVDRGLAMPGS